jgi:hypothetical protein
VREALLRMPLRALEKREQDSRCRDITSLSNLDIWNLDKIGLKLFKTLVIFCTGFS